MTAEEMWAFEEKKIKDGMAALENQIQLDQIEFRRKQSDMTAMLRHLKNELVEHNKKTPKKKE